MLQKRVNLFGVFIDDISISEALIEAKNSLTGKDAAKVFFTPNLEILNGARKSVPTRNILNSASISLPDGIGVRAVAFLLGESLTNTVTGIDFGENLFRLAAKTRSRVFLLGGKETVAEAAAQRLCQKYPSLQISGTHHGYFSDDEIDTVCKKINSCDTDILIVCRGFPRQEKFVMLAKSKLPQVKVFACLGGSLDVWSGNKKRAPKFIQNAHLEWLWRLLLEPERLERLLVSLPTLWCALKIFFDRQCIKAPDRAYNQTDTLGR